MSRGRGHLQRFALEELRRHSPKGRTARHIAAALHGEPSESQRRSLRRALQRLCDEEVIGSGRLIDAGHWGVPAQSLYYWLIEDVRADEEKWRRRRDSEAYAAAVEKGRELLGR